MIPCYEKNIVEIKKEYTSFLLDILAPLLYEGLMSIYTNCIDQHNKLMIKNKNSKNASPGVLKIFQLQLKDIPALNNHKIETETNRIREGSKCSSWFDNLIRAVIKSNIILLTFNNPNFMEEDYHDRVDTNSFIHKCYIECAKCFYMNPYLFWHDYQNAQIKKNQVIILKTIKKSVKNAIRKSIPIKDILNEFINSDFQSQKDYDYEIIKESVMKILDETGEKAVESSVFVKHGEPEIKVCSFNDANGYVDGNENENENEKEKEKKSEKENTKKTPIQSPQPVKLPKKMGQKAPPIEKDEKFNEYIKGLEGKNLIFDFNDFGKKGSRGKQSNAGNSIAPANNDKEKYFSQYL
jgi:hypothetical protein